MKKTTIYLLTVVMSFLYFGYLSVTKNEVDDIFFVFTDIFFTMIFIAWIAAGMYLIICEEREEIIS